MSGDWSSEFLRNVLDASPEGIVICSASGDNEVLYSNPAFSQLVGYSGQELLGSNLRRLQGTDREQEARQRLREAMARGETCRVVIRNYRKDATPFWNEVLLQPVRNGEGKVTHFVGYHRDAADRPKGPEREMAGLPSWMREDRLTGLASKAYFEDVLRREWASGLRIGHEISVVLYDIDNLAAYNETFEKKGGDACVRRVARTIGGGYRRGTDLVARMDGGLIAALVPGSAADKAAAYARDLVQRVFLQHIHHPRSTSRYVTVTAGVAALVPSNDVGPEAVYAAARNALKQAKQHGHSCVEVAQARDFPGASGKQSAKKSG